MPRSSIDCSALDGLCQAFAKAPVSNPNGHTGVKLHLDAGKKCPSRSYALGGSTGLNLPPGTTDFSAGSNALGQAKFAENRFHVFHHAGIIETFDGGEGGAADENGTTMIVAAASGVGFAHVFMHELGHNLGLDHAPTAAPNHLSVMGQVPETSTDGSGSNEILDYQRFVTPALDENALTESTGLGTPAAHPFYVQWICGADSYRTNHFNQGLNNGWPGDGPTDWSCSTTDQVPGINPPPDIQSGVLPPTDINGDGLFTVIPAQPNEWSLLDYRSGKEIGPR